MKKQPQDDNQQIADLLQAVTGAKKPRGEDLLGSPELKLRLAHAREKETRRAIEKQVKALATVLEKLRKLVEAFSSGGGSPVRFIRQLLDLESAAQRIQKSLVELAENLRT
jgi:hypothetical protein